MLSPRPVLLAAALLLLDGKPVQIDEIVVRGQVNAATRTVEGTITTAVRIPFGRVPVTGHARARYGCDARFQGELDYGTVVRLLARVKGVALVSEMEGRIETREPWSCQVGDSRFSARLSLQDFVLTGQIVSPTDSMAVAGRAWDAGDGAFHSHLTTQHSRSSYTVHLSFYERKR